MAGPSAKEVDRPTGSAATVIRRVVGVGSSNVAGLSSSDVPSAGRKSGRLREKGPTTYTAKGEIIRGGKRINDEIHDQPLAKRVRYDM